MARPTPPREPWIGALFAEEGGEAITILRIRSKTTISRPDIRALIFAAVEKTRYPGTTPEKFYGVIRDSLVSGKLGVFVGIEDGIPLAIAIAALPDETMMAPQVWLVYSAGKPPLIREVGKRVKAWVRAEGYDSMIGLNLYRDDAVYARWMKQAFDVEPRRLGTWFEGRF